MAIAQPASGRGERIALALGAGGALDEAGYP